MNKKVAGVILITALLFSVSFYIKFFHKDSPLIKTDAQSDNKVIDSIGDWQSGGATNISTSAIPGSITMEDINASEIDTTGKTINVSHAEIDKGRVVDGDTMTLWGIMSPGVIITGGNFWWKIDLGSSHYISNFRIGPGTTYPLGATIKYSTDDATYSTAVDSMLYSDLEWQDNYIDGGGTINARYIKIENRGSIGMFEVCGLVELEMFGSASATHTSASTQIDGSVGGTKEFIEWESFTPTYDEPANTDIRFRFRTSADGSDWTSWSSFQTPSSAEALDISEIVDSASGANKYLQVETTMSNTDGLSTPTLYDYTVNYHTNVAPSTPTAMTAVVEQ